MQWNDGEYYEDKLLKERKKFARSWTYLSKKGFGGEEDSSSPGGTARFPKESKYYPDPKWF
jgi:hypothetical protein